MKALNELFKRIKKLPGKYKIVGIVVLSLLGFFILSGNKKPTPFQFATVKKQDLQLEIIGAGTLTGKNSVNLRFKTSGKVAYINITPGDTVFEGQSIAGLDTIDLAINLRKAQNTLRDKRAIVDKIKDDLKDVGASETYVQRQTRTTVEVAQDNAYEEYLAAQKATFDAGLYSPINGIVIHALDVAGQTVSSSDLIAQIVDNSEIYFDTDIDEADIGKVKIGLPAQVILDAYGDTIYKGLVTKLLPQTKTTSSGSTVVTVRIKLDATPANFVNDLSGEAAIIIKSVKNTLTIPLEALRDDNTVFIQTENSLMPVKVTPGISSDTDVEIKKGLKEKQKVLLNPPAIGIPISKNRPFHTGIMSILGVGDHGNNRGR